MRKENTCKNLKSINIFATIFLFLLVIMNKFMMNDSSFPIVLTFIVLVLTCLMEYKSNLSSLPLKINKMYSFLWKLSLALTLFFFFYTLFLLKNPVGIESVLFLFLAFFPLVLKSCVFISFYIKFYFIKKKYGVLDITIIKKIVNTKHLILTKEQMYKEKLKMSQVFSNNKKEKKVDASLKKAIAVFNKTKLDKRIIKSFHLKNKDVFSIKKSTNEVIFKDKIYTKGKVSSLLSRCKYYLKNNRRYKLNASVYKHILHSYQEAKDSSDCVIGYAYKDKSKSVDMVFIGFIGMKYEYKDGFLTLNDCIPIVNKKTSKRDRTLKEIEDTFSLNNEKSFKILANLIIEIKNYNHNLETAILFYFSNKIITSIFIFLSFYTTSSLITVSSLLFLECIISPILFLELSLVPEVKLYKKSSFFFLQMIIKIMLNMLFFLFLYPYFRISTLRFLFFFSLLLQQIVSVYPIVCLSYKQVLKNRYLTTFAGCFLLLLLLIYKTNFLHLSFIEFLFTLFTTISIYLFIEIIKKTINRN